jgi:hypothetical protein
MKYCCFCFFFDNTDVTEGQNPYGCCPGFSAASGWDPVTGWGAPNFKNFLNAILSELGIKNLNN